MTARQDELTLVIGAHGKTGRRVAAQLREQGRAVRAVSRATEVRFDWDDRSTWPAALAGTTQAYVTFQPDLAVPGALPVVTDFFAQAVAAGCRRIVLLSGRGEVEAEAAEDALKASGADWTVLRCAWFHQNFSEAFLAGSVAAGQVALPVGDMGEPFIDADDIADVAVAALTQPGHAGRLYELTGPEPISFPQATAAIAEATGRDIVFATIAPADLRAGMAQAGVDAPTIELVLYLFRELLDGRNQQPTGDVQRVLGRPPRRFIDYVSRTAATGVWNA
ncbi:NAD(P)H-binding protein [Roseateles asaccharophilus]|uniref:Uncharacterized protein YbjT (DUF2867 family) n=1 Tax=Roseateles asaccharophilus TaxID=582607 RepID=A0ABU2AE86_9BURK|nr:NAD(P)H-binding protein [Roseateles asaccharophilus]MDR7335521.1 uncharacterized protein YbjT (DUF2867 family) [Roseateles asaccharophilus]